MDKILELINKIQISTRVLCMEGTIKKLTFDDINVCLRSLKSELVSLQENPSEQMNVEKYVNEHINYADTSSLLEELERRKQSVENIKKMMSV